MSRYYYRDRWNYMSDEEKLEYLKDEIETEKRYMASYDDLNIAIDEAIDEQNKRLNQKVRILAKENRGLRKHIQILYSRLEQLKDEVLTLKRRVRECEELAAMV